MAATTIALNRVALLLVAMWAVFAAVQGAVGVLGEGTVTRSTAVLVSLAVAVARPRSFPWLPLVVLAAATASGLVTAGLGPTDHDSTWFVWQESLVVVAAFTLPWRPALSLLVAVCATVAGALLGGGVDPASALAEQAMLLGMGVVVVSMRRALLAAAGAADRYTEARLVAEIEAATQQARHTEVLRVQRGLHDSVLNTLSGIRLPGRRDPAGVQARARADLLTLRGLAAPVTDRAALAGPAWSASPSDQADTGSDAVPQPWSASPPGRDGLAAPASLAAGDLPDPWVTGSRAFRLAVGLLLLAFALSNLASASASPTRWFALLVETTLVVTVVAVEQAHRRLGGIAGWLLAMVAPAVLVLAGWGHTSASADADPVWPTIAAVLVMWLLILTGLPGRWLVLGTLSCVVALVAVDAAPAGEWTAHTVATVAFLISGLLAALVLREAMGRLSRRAVRERNRAALLEQRTAILVAMDEVRESHVRAALDAVEPLLSGLADGTLDPSDPAVRALADAAEPSLRGLLTLGETWSRAGQVCARVAITAIRAGHRVATQEFGPVPQPDQPLVEQAVTVLEAALSAFAAPATVTLTAFSEPDGRGTVTMVVGTLAPTLRSASARYGGLQVVQAVFDDETMVEVTWTASRGTGDRRTATNTLAQPGAREPRLAHRDRDNR